MWTVRRNTYGYIEAIEKDGQTILHLIPGSKFNDAHAEDVVKMLNLYIEGVRATIESQSKDN